MTVEEWRQRIHEDPVSELKRFLESESMFGDSYLGSEYNFPVIIGVMGNMAADIQGWWLRQILKALNEREELYPIANALGERLLAAKGNGPPCPRCGHPLLAEDKGVRCHRPVGYPKTFKYCCGPPWSGHACWCTYPEESPPIVSMIWP
jgi:hypothetical protein